MSGEIIPRTRRPKAPKDMAQLENVMGEARENVALWMKQRMQEIQKSYEERIELLRNGGEHPSPIFQRMVREHALVGLEEKYIARLLFIPYSTLMTYYEEDLKMGYAEGIITMGRTLYKIGSDPSHKDAAKVALEWLGRRGGENWKPPSQQVEVKRTDQPDAPPIIDPASLTYEERQQLKAMILRVQQGGTGDPVTAEEDATLEDQAAEDDDEVIQ